ncbi:DUF4087 domain-containing protein [Yersinia mollaretii]|uniref:DUF4087 domain-containing protein n=1 Tax=Yersinia mollaretii TaxID=33060 RepID=UPI0011A8FDAF|nr:DUF4087 domain-containing protein [Yersinia mollaretii]
MNKLLVAIFVLCLPSISIAKETRCGWLDNPTPSNLWLIDKDAEWTISKQGGHIALGIDKIKDFPDDQYIHTNGNYGYGCACLVVDVDKTNKVITTIYGAKNIDISQCQNDKKIKTMLTN